MSADQHLALALSDWQRKHNIADGDPMIAVLDFAQRYTARVDFSTMASAEADLDRTHAFRDPYDAEQAGLRLQLP